MRRDRGHAVGAGALAVLAALVVAAPAHATGFCGSDLTQATACGIAASPTTVTGSIASMTETDWFVFWARYQTNISLTLNDTEDPACSDPTGGSTLCGGVQMTISHGPTSGTSSPAGGSADPQTLGDIVSPGVYYVQVYGTPDLSGAPVPYSLSFDGSTSPTVRWPPLCVVPRISRGASLQHARSALTRARCAAGRVTRAYSSRVRRGRVIDLRVSAGRTRAEHTKVGIVVSRGPRRRRH